MTEEAKKIKFSFPPEMISRLISLSSSKSWINQKKERVEELFQICEHSTEAETVMHSLEHFQYISGDALGAHLKQIKDQIVDIWKLIPQDTCIVCKDIEGKTDSSAAMQQMVKPLFAEENNWSSNVNFVSNIETTLKKENIKNIVLVDDFSGTGNGLNTLCEWIAQKCNEFERDQINVFAAFVGAMNETMARAYGGNLKGIFRSVTADRAFTGKFPDGGALAINAMKNIAQNYGNIGRKNYLGYDKSEAIIHIQNLNTPNNTLPIFWQVGTRARPMFPRLKK